MPPKQVEAQFSVDGVQFQPNGKVINSVRVQGSKGIVIKVPAAGWKSDAERDAKIRSTKGFDELKTRAAACSSEQPIDINQLPGSRSVDNVGVRDLRSLGELAEPLDESRSHVQPDIFMHSEYSVRDDYKSRNLGSRNGKVRDVSYAEATQKLEEMGLQAEAWLHEVRRVVVQMDLILEENPPEQAAAARALQAALIELVDDAGDDDDDGAEACGECEPDVESNVPRPTGAISIVTA